MSFHTSPEAAYGAAHARLVQILRSHDAPDDVAATIATEVLAELRQDGWAWRRREPPPAPRWEGRPTPPPDYAAERERVRAENERRLAAVAAREKQPLEPAP